MRPTSWTRAARRASLASGWGGCTSTTWSGSSAAPGRCDRVGLLAGTHHERLDGSGYHRGVGGHMLSTSARLLAAADAFQAMRQHRPHRRAMNAEEASRRLRTDARDGRLDEVVVEAVLEAAGMAGNRARGTAAPGLTVREREVLPLLTQVCRTRRSPVVSP
jgi:hypothetical protein